MNVDILYIIIDWLLEFAFIYKLDCLIFPWSLEYALTYLLNLDGNKNEHPTYYEKIKHSSLKLDPLKQKQKLTFMRQLFLEDNT